MGQEQKPSGPVIHMIGNAHIDPAWLWTRAEGKQEVLNTARTVVQLMKEYPQMTFSFSQTQSYVWIEETDPALFSEIQKLVAAGRWYLVGGMWVQPDCNIPCGESFVRQLLYSQRYFRSRFAQHTTVGYNVDSFGHAGTLPQILKKSGIDSYVYFRPDPETEAAMDESIYLWQALDGSEIIAYRPPNHYCTWSGDIEAWIVNSVIHAPERLGAVICFYGVGDHGGGPTRENLASIQRLQERGDLPPIIHGSLADFFAQARAKRQDYSVRRNDLQHHAPGCYSVLSEIKRANRKAEQYALAVEKANAMLAMLGGPLAGTEAFAHLWQPIMFNQFHDILAGTCIPDAYTDCRIDYAEIERMCQGISQVVLDRLAAMTDCRGDGQPIFLLNPCSWERQAVIELADGSGQSVSVADKSLPTQITPDGKLLVKTPLPACGGLCLHRRNGTEAVSETTVLASGHTLENEYWRLEIDAQTGDWLSLFDKKANVEVLNSKGNILSVIDDPSDTWSHGVRSYNVEVGRFADASVQVYESGPVRASLLIKRRYQRSLVIERVSLYAGLPGIEVSTMLDWHEQRKALKVSFPVRVAYPVCTYEAPYGVVTRVANGAEDPGQMWIDASGVAHNQDGAALPYGFSLINDSKYGFDMKSHGGYTSGNAYTDVRMTILRSPAYAFHDPRQFDPQETYTFIDQGEQTFVYWLLPHQGSWQQAGTAKLAHEFNAPVLAMAVKPNEGGLPASWSLAACDDKNIEISVLKQSEDGDAFILRLCELAGIDRTATVRFPLWDSEIELPLGHYEIKTIKLTRGERGFSISETNLLEDIVTGGYSSEMAFI